MTTLTKTTRTQNTEPRPAKIELTSSRSFSRFITTLAISPALLIVAAFGGAFALTGFIAPGTTGGEALVFSSVVIGLIGGFLLAMLNPDYPLPAALYSASLTCLMYLSIRLFWLSAPLTLMSSGFLLIIPAALLGGYTAIKLRARG